MRLIDADKLERYILSQTIVNETDAKIMDRYLYCINDQPTAYDIDKVVEELENEINLYENSKSIMGGNDFDIEYDWAMKGLCKAIEIVKQHK